MVEHFHGKEGVSSSNLEGGSMRRDKKKSSKELYFYIFVQFFITKVVS